MKKFDRIEVLKDFIGSPEDFKDVSVKRPSWNEYFMILAKMAATRSTCLSRPAGAVLVRDKQLLSTGYNGSMPGIAHCSDEGYCFRRGSGAGDAGKYDSCRSGHAEANALAQAAKNGINVNGASTYVTLYPCYVCTKLLVQAGIKKVYYEYEYRSVDPERDKLWEEALKQAGLEIEKVEISDDALAKTMISLLSPTSWRRELQSDGKPTGKIENIHGNTKK